MVPYLALFVFAAAPVEPALTVKQWHLLDEAVMAYQNGQPREFLERIGPLLARGDRIAEAIAREFAAARLPPLDEMLVESRLKAAQQGDRAVIIPRLPELRVTMPYVQRRIEESIREFSQRRVLTPQLTFPTDMRRFEELFWELNVLERDLDEAESIVRLLPALVRGIAQRDLARLDAAFQELFQRDIITSTLQRIGELRGLAHERGIELRLHRLRLARDLLHAPERGPDQVGAAALWKRDLEEVERFYSSNRAFPPQSESLAQAGVLDNARSQAREIARLAGDLTENAELLMEGLGWWTRGRYGAGPLAGGLLKSPAALADPRPQLELSMPDRLPEPGKSPAEAEATADYPARRHQYIWSVYDRFEYGAGPSWPAPAADQLPPAEPSAGRYPGGSALPPRLDPRRFRDLGMWTPQSQAFLRRIARPDSALLPRLVGYLEYGAAISCFDELYRRATADELQAMNELVASWPSFAVQTNLARELPHDAASAFAESPRDKDDTFVRQGLDWVTALARVEWSCMLAAWTKDPYPFRRFPPADFDRASYAEIVVDALRWHQAAMRSDPVLLNLKAVHLAERDALAYDRRVQMVRKLALAAADLWGNDMELAQIEEIRRLDRNLERAEVLLRSYRLKLGSGRLSTLAEERTIGEILRRRATTGSGAP